MTDLSTQDLYRRAHDALLSQLTIVHQVDLDRPTPCAGWDVRTLLGHVGAVAAALTHQATTGELQLRPVQASDIELVDAVRARMTSAVDAVAVAQPERAEAAATSGVVELTTHGWDLATAIGTRLPLDDRHAEQARRLVESLVTDDARGDHFAPARAVPPNRSPLDRMAAFLGRSPVPPR